MSETLPGIFKTLDQKYNFIEVKQVENFLRPNPALINFLHDSEQPIKSYFPEAHLALKLAKVSDGDEPKLLLLIQAQGDKAVAQKRFNKLKSEWWFSHAESFLEQISLAIEHPEFSTVRAIEDLTSLIGSVEAPKDWSVEHDHYLYGTPKHNQTKDNA